MNLRKSESQRRAKSLLWQRSVVAVLATGFLVPAIPASADDNKAKTPKVSGLARDQRNVSERFRRLDQRMQELADKIRKRQPEDADRLLNAYKEIRNRLIREDLEKITKSLEKRDLFAAHGHQKEVLKDLQALQRILRGELEEDQEKNLLEGGH